MDILCRSCGFTTGKIICEWRLKFLSSPDLKALAPNRVNLLIFALRGLQDFIVA